MLTIALDTAALQEKLETMEQQLKEFPHNMAEELTEWQTEDMKRKYPNTMETDTEVSTEIWPTSRTAERDVKKVKAALRAHKQAMRRGTAVVRRPGTSMNRPILRPELFDKLCARMSDLMKECLAWR